MEFWKMNGAGNDFIILNNLREHLPESAFPALARTLCRRRLSLGADGLMVVTAPKRGGSFRMLFFNADGSVGEMCGNGARCICRYGYENDLAGDVQSVETTAGLVTGQRLDKRTYRVRLNTPTVVRLNGRAALGGHTYPYSYVELGDPGLPHAVVEYPGLRDADEDALRSLGRDLRHYAAFPKGANVNFYEVIGRDLLYERTFERGVEDFTYACGTGTGSVVAVLTLLGVVSGSQVRVQMTGGELVIDAQRRKEQITALYLTGPTNLVARGEITDEELAAL